MIVATAAVASLALLSPTAEGACPLLRPLCKETPTPSPSPSPSQSSSPASRPRPSSSTAPQQSAPPQNGPAPAPYAGLRSAITWVLDTVGTARHTQRLLDLLTVLKPAGQPLTQADLVRGFGRFPVLGYVWYQNDYGAPRYLPYFHLHEGVDLFAASGSPVIACVDGVIAKVANGSIGGISFWLAGNDGITYYYGHLMSFAPGLVAGKRVRVGDVLGFVGDTGVAKGTSPHLHFEMHPGGGLPVSPKPVLDGWLNQATAHATDAYRRLVEFNALTRIGAARWQSVLDLLREPAAPVARLWPVALDLSASSLGIDAAFDAIAWGVDLGGVAASQPIGIDAAAAPMIGELMKGPAWLSPSGSTLTATRGAVR